MQFALCVLLLCSTGICSRSPPPLFQAPCLLEGSSLPCLSSLAFTLEAELADVRGVVSHAGHVLVQSAITQTPGFTTDTAC